MQFVAVRAALDAAPRVDQRHIAQRHTVDAALPHSRGVRDRVLPVLLRVIQGHVGQTRTRFHRDLRGPVFVIFAKEAVQYRAPPGGVFQIGIDPFAPQCYARLDRDGRMQRVFPFRQICHAAAEGRAVVDHRLQDAGHIGVPRGIEEIVPAVDHSHGDVACRVHPGNEFRFHRSHTC
jgi:hypothetical protein